MKLESSDMSTTQIFVLINLIGGIAVLGSYVSGLWYFPELKKPLWGGVPGFLRIFFTMSMVGAAVGYLAFVI